MKLGLQEFRVILFPAEVCKKGPEAIEAWKKSPSNRKAVHPLLELQKTKPGKPKVDLKTLWKKPDAKIAPKGALKRPASSMN